ncbi:MAG: iron ABC transporter permease [Planctomycetales bacterium]|nr:iron ABC transporter permease [Planctomycetales bacterium]
MSVSLPERGIACRLLAASLLGLLVCFVLASARLRGLLVNSAWLTGGALAVGVLPGTFLAVAIAKTSVVGRRLIEGLLVALLFVPLYVQAAAWHAVWGPTGWLTDQSPWLAGWRGAVWVHGVAAIPWVAIAVSAALKSIPREFEEGALMDANAWSVVTRVSLRRAGVGVVAASLWVAVICFGEIAVTDLFQVRTFAEEIYTAANLGVLGGVVTAWEDTPQLATRDLWLGTTAVLMLVLATIAVIWFWLPSSVRESPGERWVWQLGVGRHLFSIATWLLVVMLVGVPVVSLLNKSGMQTRQVDERIVRQWSAAKAVSLVFRSPWEHRRECRWSFAIGGVAAAAATSTGAVIAWGLRTRRLPAWPTVLLLAFGFAIPGPLTAVWLIGLLNHSADSIWSALTWCYDHTVLAPVLVQFFRALPLATLVLWSQLASLPQDVLDSATSEGAGWWTRLFVVALPQRWPAVAAAGCMSLIVSVSELAATLLLAPPGVATLSMRIFGLLHYGSDDRVSALCLALAMAIGLLTAAVWSVYDRSGRQTG